MHLEHKPGETMQVDWAGQTAALVDTDTGEQLDAYLFVAVLPYSGYAYAEAFLDMNIQWCCFLWNFSGSIPVYHRISSLGYTLSSIASVPVFLFVGHGVGQNVMFS